MKCAILRDHREKENWAVTNALNEIEGEGKNRVTCVENHHVGVTCDSARCNHSSITIIGETHYKLCTSICCTHVTDLMMEYF